MADNLHVNLAAASIAMSSYKGFLKSQKSRCMRQNTTFRFHPVITLMHNQMTVLLQKSPTVGQMRQVVQLFLLHPLFAISSPFPALVSSIVVLRWAVGYTRVSANVPGVAQTASSQVGLAPSSLRRRGAI